MSKDDEYFHAIALGTIIDRSADVMAESITGRPNAASTPSELFHVLKCCVHVGLSLAIKYPDLAAKYAEIKDIPPPDEDLSPVDMVAQAKLELAARRSGRIH